MFIDFGKINRYIKDRGFGFISMTFSKEIEMESNDSLNTIASQRYRINHKAKNTDEVFFHITTVEKNHTDLLEKINKENLSSDSEIFIWYEYKITCRGKEVVSFLDSQKLKLHYNPQLNLVINIIKNTWLNIDRPLDVFIKKATGELLEKNQIQQLKQQRQALKDEKSNKLLELHLANAVKCQEKIEQKSAREKLKVDQDKSSMKKKSNTEIKYEQENQLENEVFNINPKSKIIENNFNEQNLHTPENTNPYDKNIEEIEFSELVAEVQSFGFTHSHQLSNHIVKNKLGHKYRHISGILEMSKDGKSWEFDGGFPSKIYTRLRIELGLENKGSRAVPSGFKPYKDM